MVEADKTKPSPPVMRSRSVAAFVLGAGREHASQDVHRGGPHTAQEDRRACRTGEPLVTLRVGDKGIEAATSLVRDAYGISESA